ncbi:unnamed protein product, partial [Timema podura]|nr:unnamed protein product [Timema podura]
MLTCKFQGRIRFPPGTSRGSNMWCGATTFGCAGDSALRLLSTWLSEALHYLTNSRALINDNRELVHTLVWAPASAVVALAYFSRQFPPHPITAQYAIRVLRSCSVNSLLFFVPQIVQALRHDILDYMAELIKDIANKSQILAHQLIYNMRTNMFLDEDMLFKDGPRRRQACLEALSRIELQPGCYIPTNPEAMVIAIDNKSGTPMQ